MTAMGRSLPVAVGRALGLHEGQNVAIRIEGESLVIDAPADLASVREEIRRQAQAKGTWGKLPVAGDG